MKSLIQLLSPLLLLFSLQTFGFSDQFSGQIKEIKKLTENGYYNFNSEAYQSAIANCDRILSIDEENPFALYYKAYSFYRLLNFGMVQNNKEILSVYLQPAIETASVLVKYDSFESEAYTVMAAIQMMNLAQNPGKGAQLFPETSGYLNKAIAADSSNPRAYLVYAILMFNTPAQFGGGPKTSINLLAKANALFNTKQNDSELMPDWGKYEAKAWEGMAHQQLGDTETAKKIYTNIINERPDFGWVKYKLLPSVGNTGQQNPE